MAPFPATQFLSGHTSLGSAISEFAAPLKEVLISRENFSLVKRIAGIFPLSLSRFWCLELPLSEIERKADLLFCISNPGYLKECFLHTCPPSVIKEGLAWTFSQGIREFADAWANRKDLALQKIVNAWFEYDHQQIREGFLTPNFFYAPAKGMHPLALVHISNTIFGMISAKPVPATTYKLLLECVHHLPGNSWISQVGMMLARKENNLRLFIQQIPSNGIAGYLAKIKYPYVADKQFTSLLTNCYLLADQVDLDIDVAEALGDTVGLECSFNEIQKALNFLEYLFSQELCRLEKYNALCTCLEKIHFDSNAAYQPFLSHFKIVFHPQKRLVAKVYIGYAETTAALKIIRTKPLNC